MKTRYASVLVIALSLVAGVTVAISHAQRPTPQSRTLKKPEAATNAQELQKFALLVGINHYLHEKDAGLRSLDGCENDVALMKDTLERAYGFEDQNIKTLIGPQATHEAIAGATGLFRSHLIANAMRVYEQNRKNREKGALVVFHFSGHGSQIKNQAGDVGDEPDDGMDETIVPYDSRDKLNKVSDIIDDELNDLMIELTRYTNNIVFILDSCHSGSASRGDEDRLARTADEDKRPNTYVRKNKASEEELANKYVTISGSLANEQSFERPVREKVGVKHNGLLTYYLAQALWRADKLTTYRELQRQIAAGVKSELQYGQDPNIEGDINRPILGGASLRGSPYFEILSKPNNDQITFAAGRLHGVREGAQVAIYSREAPSYVGEAGWLTSATVTHVEDLKSVARMPKASDNPKVAQVKKDSRVILTAPNFGGDPIGIALNPKVRAGDKKIDPTVITGIAQHLADGKLIENGLVTLLDVKLVPHKDEPLSMKDGSIQIVEDQAAVDPNLTLSGAITLRRGKFGNVFKNNEDLPPPKNCHEEESPPPAAETDIYYLDEGNGRPMFGFYVPTNDATAGEEIGKVIGLRAKQQNLLAINQSSSPLSGDGTTGTIKVTLEKYPTHTRCVYNEQRKAWGRVLEDPTSRPAPTDSVTMERGEVFRFKIENTAERHCYVTAFLLGQNGSIRRVYPVVESEGNLGDGELAGKGAAEPAHSITMVVTRPFGNETLKIMVTKVHVPGLAFLEQEGVRARGRGDESPLERLINQSGQRTRDDTVMTNEPSAWGVVTINLRTCKARNAQGKCKEGAAQ